MCLQLTAAQAAQAQRVLVADFESAQAAASGSSLQPPGTIWPALDEL
jgi:hypothetical protein